MMSRRKKVKVSSRERWQILRNYNMIRGSEFLQTRLYMNSSSVTSLLPVPASSATPPFFHSLSSDTVFHEDFSSHPAEKCLHFCDPYLCPLLYFSELSNLLSMPSTCVCLVISLRLFVVPWTCSPPGFSVHRIF